jgi:hypothetical protein
MGRSYLRARNTFIVPPYVTPSCEFDGLEAFAAFCVWEGGRFCLSACFISKTNEQISIKFRIGSPTLEVIGRI